jgi:UDP-N-acetylmuramoyl-L-alanyl-D-glutamate--2,6-diaminopimelate ligase
MSGIKKTIKSIMSPNLLKAIRPVFHGLKAYVFALLNGFPASKLKIIAITGTKGKTSTAVMTGRLMNELGYKTGFASTALLYDGQKESLNYTKMTSIDPALLQKMLAKMLKNGCKYVVLEMSSQGLEQNRHKGLGGFDLGMFLNLYPEHVEAHGSFEKYRDAKGVLFKNIKQGGVALVIDKPEFQETMDYYLAQIKESRGDIRVVQMNSSVYETLEAKGSQFQNLKMYGGVYSTNLVADFEVENLAFAIKAAEIITNDEDIAQKIIPIVDHLGVIPGRMEYVVKGSKNLLNGEQKNLDKEGAAIIDVIVDYAHETGSMERLLENLSSWKARGYYDYIIHLVSCDGVGRDDWKKPVLGEISQKYADFSIVSTDNYEKGDNPDEIIKMISETFNPDNEGKTYTSAAIRKDAMVMALKKAMEQGGKKVLVVSTGVGAEQQLTQPEGLMQWDERKIWAMLFDEIC